MTISLFPIICSLLTLVMLSISLSSIIIVPSLTFYYEIFQLIFFTAASSSFYTFWLNSSHASQLGLFFRSINFFNNVKLFYVINIVPLVNFFHIDDIALKIFKWFYETSNICLHLKAQSTLKKVCDILFLFRYYKVLPTVFTNVIHNIND